MRMDTETLDILGFVAQSKDFCDNYPDLFEEGEAAEVVDRSIWTRTYEMVFKSLRNNRLYTAGWIEIIDHTQSEEYDPYISPLKEKRSDKETFMSDAANRMLNITTPTSRAKKAVPEYSMLKVADSGVLSLVDALGYVEEAWAPGEWTHAALEYTDSET